VASNVCQALEPGSWAHDTVSRRLRENILSRVFADNPHLLPPGSRAEAALKALDAELATAATSTLRAIAPDGGMAWQMLLATS